MMIHIFDSGVNTFLKQNVLTTAGRCRDLVGSVSGSENVRFNS